MERDDTPVIVERVVGEYIDVSSWCWHRKGTNDYSSDRIDILKIVDGEGKGYEGVWEKGWTGLFPVVETREGGRWQGSAHSQKGLSGAGPYALLLRVRFLRP